MVTTMGRQRGKKGVGSGLRLRLAAFVVFFAAGDSSDAYSTTSYRAARREGDLQERSAAGQSAGERAGRHGSDRATSDHLHADRRLRSARAATSAGGMGRAHRRRSSRRLNRSHRCHLEATCRLMVKIRYGSPKTGDYANLNKFLTQMGMNPAAQSTVSGGAFAPAGGATSIGALARKAQDRRAG